MFKPFKDLPFNKTHDLRVEGKLVKRDKEKKPTISDVLHGMNIMKNYFDKRFDKQEEFNKEVIKRFDKQEQFNKEVIKRFDNLVIKNNLKE